MSSARLPETEPLTERRRKHADPAAGRDIPEGSIPALDGPLALKPSAVLQRQAVLGNAHFGRIFRSPAEEAGGEGKKGGCQCADEEHCTCPK